MSSNHQDSCSRVSTQRIFPNSHVAGVSFMPVEHMTRYPFSYQEALAVYSDFKKLKGQAFSHERAEMPVEVVAIAPFDEINKFIFMTEYRREKDPEKALELYGGTLFDVIVIAHDENDAEKAIYKDLNVYLTERKIPFNTIKYEKYSGKKLNA